MHWYESQCDGEWEHGFGPSIGTIDNPGWSLKIELAGTQWDGHTMGRIQHNYDDETEWWTCWVEENAFHGAGGPLQLGAMIEAFRRWTEALLNRGAIPN
jgi:hypothetical protein